MYLKKLQVIKNTGEEIQNIKFHLGLNLVVGEADDNGSSNSLGKTTLCRCINFCLAGKVEEFFIDSESKNIENTEIKNFLINNQIIFELTLGKDIDIDLPLDIKISRQVSFDQDDQKIVVLNRIDGNEFSFDHFQEQLKLKLFSTTVSKPTFRNIITKFVRRTDIEVNNILKYLNVYTSNIDYTTLRFFLFGFSDSEVIERKQIIEKNVAKITKQFKALKAIIPEGNQQKIDLLQIELSEKESLRDSFKVEEEYKIDESELAKIENQISELNLNISTLNSDKLTLINRKDQIISNEFKDNIQNIKYLYEEAELLNIDIQNKFEETVSFHNSMLKNEETYLNKRIDKLTSTIENLKIKWASLTKEYNILLEKLSKQGALAEYTKLNDKIISLSSELSEKKALQVQLDELTSRKNQLIEQLRNITDEIDTKIDEFKKINITTFNLYFSKYSEKLYNERWYVTFDPDGENFKFDVQAFESNAGSGKKQTLVAAFDIAYMSFIQDSKINLPYPRFATQDKIEVIDIVELEELSNLVLNASGQLVTPIIQDKFINFNIDDIEEKVILRLSPTNKFFKI
ncbi:hypothetical protein [Acinetobacter sp.]|uniref:hypothetical protein n=1 Tax=Acinetobacter sp. TaxID=472 RepID=UPI00333FB5CB